MASDLEFAEYVCEQIGLDERISLRKMFGEFAVYCDGKVVGLICDNQLFVKMTAGGRAWAPELLEGQPFAGAKPWLRVDTELEDRGWLTELVRITEREVPIPKPKKKERPGT
jgi:TfoX/Sxy family transcriptional regulator of competence genes